MRHEDDPVVLALRVTFFIGATIGSIVGLIAGVAIVLISTRGTP